MYYLITLQCLSKVSMPHLPQPDPPFLSFSSISYFSNFFFTLPTLQILIQNLESVYLKKFVFSPFLFIFSPFFYETRIFRLNSRFYYKIRNQLLTYLKIDSSKKNKINSNLKGFVVCIINFVLFIFFFLK